MQCYLVNIFFYLLVVLTGLHAKTRKQKETKNYLQIQGVYIYSQIEISCKLLCASDGTNFDKTWNSGYLQR